MSQDREERIRRMRAALAKRGAIPVPRIDEAPKTSKQDDAAFQEASAIAAGNLEEEALKKEHNRTERFRDHVAVAMLIVFWLGFLAAVGAAGLWTADFLVPSKELLDDSQANTIISFLTGGGILTFVSGYAKKRLR